MLKHMVGIDYYLKIEPELKHNVSKKAWEVARGFWCSKMVQQKFETSLRQEWYPFALKLEDINNCKIRKFNCTESDG